MKTTISMYNESKVLYGATNNKTSVSYNIREWINPINNQKWFFMTTEYKTSNTLKINIVHESLYYDEVLIQYQAYILSLL